MDLLFGLMWPLLAQGENHNYEGTVHEDNMLEILSVFLCRMTIWLSTSPNEPLTHWYQVRCLLQTPLFAKMGQTLSGRVHLIANKRYD